VVPYLLAEHPDLGVIEVIADLHRLDLRNQVLRASHRHLPTCPLGRRVAGKGNIDQATLTALPPPSTVAAGEEAKR